MPETFAGHVSELIPMIQNDESLIGTSSGQWSRSGWLGVRWQNFTGRSDSRLISLGKAYARALDRLEKSYSRAENPDWFRLGDIIVEKLQSCSNETARKVAYGMRQRLIGLRHREESASGAPLALSERIFFFEQAVRWKSKQRHFDVTAWLEQDQRAIAKVCDRYPDFVRLTREDPKLFSKFLDWSIRDQMDPSAFVEFPKTQELLYKIELSASAYVAKKPKLKIKTRDGVKFLTFPLYANHGGRICSKSIRLWDKDRQFELPGGFRTPLREIYRELKRKNKYWVNYLITENGIENWNVQEWGSFDAEGNITRAALPQDRWFHNVPILERLSLEEAQERYGDDLNGENFGVALVAARKKLDLDVIGTHSYLELCIPDNEGGYFTLNPGKFAIFLPENMWEYIKIFGDTVDGCVVSHDPNKVQPWRQHTHYSVVIETPEFLSFAEVVRQSIEDGRHENFVFSIFADSCSVWTQNLINRLLRDLPEGHPLKLEEGEEANFFEMEILDTEPRGLLQNLLKFVKLFPESLQRFMAYLVLCFFYPFRGKTVYDENGTPRWVSAFRCPSWNRLHIHNPPYLFYQQKEHRRFLPSGRLPAWLEI